MSEQNSGATARVTVTVELRIDSTWGAECSVDQVYMQAKSEAEGIIRRLVDDRKTTKVLRLIGEPIVAAIIVPRST